MADNRICNQRAIAGLHRVLHCREGATKVGKRAAAALARTAIVAGGASIVSLGHDGGASDGEGAPKLRLHPLPQAYFSASHLHGREELAVGQHVVALSRPRDADITLDDVVIGSKICIREGPVVSVAIA